MSPLIVPVTHHYNGFPLAYTDYNITVEQITINAFVTTTPFTVGIIDDVIVEGDEVFRATIAEAIANFQNLPVDQPQSDVTIVDDDGE